MDDFNQDKSRTYRLDKTAFMPLEAWSNEPEDDLRRSQDSAFDRVRRDPVSFKLDVNILISLI